MLGVGVFAPLVKVPIFGSVSYFQVGVGGYIMLTWAVVSLALTLSGGLRGLWATGILALGQVGYLVLGFQADKAKASGFERFAAEMVQFDWGVGVLSVGAVLLLVAAAQPSRE